MTKISKHKKSHDFWEDTLPKTIIAPENGWLEDEFPFGFRPISRGKLPASFREGTLPETNVAAGDLKKY